MQQVLPNDCKFSSSELAERIKNGVTPDSAEEYLARVHLEAKQYYVSYCDDAENDDALRKILKERAENSFFRAENSTEGLKRKIKSVETSSVLYEFQKRKFEIDNIMSSKEKGVLDELAIPILPKRNEKLLWNMIIFGTKGVSQSTIEASQDRRKHKVELSDSGTQLSLSLLIHIDYGTVCCLLQRLSWEDNSNSTQAFTWIYSLLLRIERPFDSDLEAALVNLHRRVRDAKEELMASVKVVLEEYFNLFS